MAATRSTAARTPAPRKTAAPKSAPPETPRPTPLVVFDRSKPAPEPEQVLVFEVDGEGFYAPDPPKAGILLAYLKIMRTQGSDAGHAYLIDALCGPRAYSTLAGDAATTLDDIADVVAALKKLLVGSPGNPKA